MKRIILIGAAVAIAATALTASAFFAPVDAMAHPLGHTFTRPTGVLTPKAPTERPTAPPAPPTVVAAAPETSTPATVPPASTPAPVGRWTAPASTALTPVTTTTTTPAPTGKWTVSTGTLGGGSAPSTVAVYTLSWVATEPDGTTVPGSYHGNQLVADQVETTLTAEVGQTLPGGYPTGTVLTSVTPVSIETEQVQVEG